MGFMDKLKNIFFEEEEVESEETNHSKEKEVVVKKIEIPKIKKEDKEDVPPIEKSDKEKETPVEFEVKKESYKNSNELIFDDEDFVLEPPKTTHKEIYKTPKQPSKSRENKEMYINNDLYSKKEYVSNRYSTKPADYSNKENTKKTFIPSPIISPIYGILDKNYKKEEVKEKKEIKLSIRPSKMDFDTVRNKAFGNLENDLFSETETTDKSEEKVVSKNSNDIKKMYDMTNQKEKQSVESVTLGEADEYFNDLGLAYNTDYKDISKEVSDGKVKIKKDNENETLEDNLFDLIESMYDKED